jgi:uncharacterized small protein (DUF1192 family)
VTAVQGEVLAVGQWTPQEAATYVVEAYAKSVLAVIDTGRRLLEAKQRLPHGGWLPFVDLLPFSERSAQMFMRIAEHPLLSNPQHASDLPASWYTLSVLAQLPAAEIEARIAAGEITPELERSKAEEWARVHQAAKQEAINAWTEAVDGLTRALSWANGYPPPQHLPKSHVQPAEFIERLDALKKITDEWSI